jgi:arginase
MQRKIEIIVNNSELTAGTRGASLGPKAMMTAARSSGSNFFSRFPITFLPDQNFYLDREIDTPFAKRIEGYTHVFRDVAEQTEGALRTGKFPLLISGDHGSAAGTMAGIRRAFPDARLGVVWIDAHADIHSPYTTPSGNMHGMPLSIMLADDNLEMRRNDPDELTVSMWEGLKDYATDISRLRPRNLVFVGVRDTEKEEDAIMRRLGIKNHTVSEVREKGTTQIVEEILAQLEPCDLIYVSFDVDSMDPELTSYGTGTPVENGITPEEARGLLTLLAANDKVACMEFVEVNPCLDNKTNKMAETAFSLLEATANTILQP